MNNIPPSSNGQPPVQPPVPQPAQTPVPQPVPQPMYTYQRPRPVQPRPMVAQRPAPVMARKIVKKKSLAPWFLIVLWWLLYAIFVTFDGWIDVALATGGSIVLFIASRLLIRDREISVPMTMQELAVMEEQQRRKDQAAARAAEEAASVIPKEARDYLRQMREANVAIQDEAVSAKIRVLETRTDQIFRVVSENPDKLPAIRKFMDYYLPTLLKLLRSYDHMEEQGIQGENIRRTMTEIEKVLDTVVQAFDKQLDSLFQAEAMDISSDIRVLENVMTQEGLLRQDVFNKDSQPPKQG